MQRCLGRRWPPPAPASGQPASPPARSQPSCGSGSRPLPASSRAASPRCSSCEHVALFDEPADRLGVGNEMTHFALARVVVRVEVDHARVLLTVESATPATLGYSREWSLPTMKGRSGPRDVAHHLAAGLHAPLAAQIVDGGVAVVDHVQDGVSVHHHVEGGGRCPRGPSPGTSPTCAAPGGRRPRPSCRCPCRGESP